MVSVERKHRIREWMPDWHLRTAALKDGGCESFCMIVEGTILRGRSFSPIEGQIVIEDGTISTIEERPVESDSIVLPTFVNAHTHIGDSIAKEAGAGLSLEELVAPPDGLKHRLLRTAPRQHLIDAMRRTLRFMEATGTGVFLDFREGGEAGVTALQEAADGMDIEAIILGRDELEAIERGDGCGASGAADGEFSAERRKARESGKLFGIHAGEVDPADINPALDLEPDFLVHAVTAQDVHLERIADSGVPVVVCPRSNAETGVGEPPIEALAERTTVALGTDNVMISNPSMFREMAFVDAMTDLEPATILGMATWAGAEIAGLEGGVIAEGRPGSVLVLDGASDNLADTHDVVRAVVRRAGAVDVEAVIR